MLELFREALPYIVGVGGGLGIFALIANAGEKTTGSASRPIDQKAAQPGVKNGPVPVVR